MLDLPRINYVEFACGVKGSGKSFALARRAARFPRRIILDYADEFFGVYGGAHECLTIGQVLDALEDVAPSGKWTVVASLSDADMVKLAAVLSPLGRPRSGYAYAVGGVLLECGEVERIAPNRGLAPEIAELVHRGRHSRTSMAWGTRRPRDVNRLVTSQCDVVACFRQQEVDDIEYLAGLVGRVAAERIGTLGEHHHVLSIPKLNKSYIINQDGKQIEALW